MPALNTSWRFYNLVAKPLAALAAGMPDKRGGMPELIFHTDFRFFIFFSSCVTTVIAANANLYLMHNALLFINKFLANKKQDNSS